MNKDDILAMSRAEQKGSDEYEKHVMEKASKLAAQVGLIVCCVVATVSVMVTDRPNYACWVIYFSIYASLFWVKFCFLRKRHELAMAVTASLVGLLCFGFFVLEMVRWANG